MLNANNIGLVRYKTVKVATLDSINQMFFFSFTRCPKRLSVNLSLALLHAVDNVYEQKKSVMCLVVVQPM